MTDNKWTDAEGITEVKLFGSAEIKVDARPTVDRMTAQRAKLINFSCNQDKLDCTNLLDVTEEETKTIMDDSIIGLVLDSSNKVIAIIEADLLNPLSRDCVVGIQIPTLCKCGKLLHPDLIDDVLWKVNTSMAESFGGTSPIPIIQGVWIDENHEFVAENSTRITSFTNRVRFQIHEHDLKQLAISVADQLSQSCVIMSIESHLEGFLPSDPDEICYHEGYRLFQDDFLSYESDGENYRIRDAAEINAA